MDMITLSNDVRDVLNLKLFLDFNKEEKKTIISSLFFKAKNVNNNIYICLYLFHDENL